MLTRELGIFSVSQGYVIPDQLKRGRDACYLELAKSLIAIYLDSVGATRESIHRRVDQAANKIPDAPPRRIACFKKLLDDSCEFKIDKRGTAAKLRQEVFEFSARYQPVGFQNDRLVGTRIFHVRQAIEEHFGRTWADIESSLYLDLPQNQILLANEELPTSMQLLAQYNVAQQQVALFDATSMKIDAAGDFKSILRYIKLARLMHRIRTTKDGYRIQVDGPASIVGATRRYGVAIARCLPGLLSCRNWRAVATIKRPKWGTLKWSLTSEAGLSSNVKPHGDFDSALEEEFFGAWQAYAELQSAEPMEWQIERESTVLNQGQSVFIPDFTAVHQSGMRIPIEIVGFWTPEYLQHKREQLQRFQDLPLVVILPKRLAEIMPIAKRHASCLFKSKIQIPEVLTCLSTLKSIQ